MKAYCSNCGSAMSYGLKKINRFRQSTGEQLFVITSTCPRKRFYNLCNATVLGASVFEDAFFASTWYDETYTAAEAAEKIKELEK